MMEGSNNDSNNNNEMKELLGSLHEPATPSPEFKAKLLESLINEAEGTAAVSHTAWSRPEKWVPVAGAIIAVVIGYGVWLSLTYVA
jgi:anti-sigma-K factor RskA